MKHQAPAAARNREPIREVLARVLPASGVVLEIASGSGEHALWFAAALPAITWQPSDPDPQARASIAAHRDDGGTPNLRAPIALDAAAPAWPIEHADAIVCINMIHISSWEATLGLFAGARRLHVPIVVTYGPYLVDGETAPSNRAFDQSLRSRDPRWGVRELREIETAAEGFTVAEVVEMPANNLSIVFRAKLG